MAIIRPAGITDCGILNNLAEAIWWPTYEPIVGAEQVRYMLDAFYNLAVLEQQIGGGEQAFIILEEENEPVGFAAYATRKENPEIYKLHKLYCLPARQGNGYGKILLAAVEDAVKQAGKNILELNVNRYNPAKGFYEKMGYAVVYKEDVPIGGYWMNDFVMRKEL